MKPRMSKKPVRKEKKRSETFFLVMTLVIFLVLAIFLFWYFGTI
jgi:hypothetical protein